MKKNPLILLIFLGIAIVDQATKAAVDAYITPFFHSIDIIPGLFRLVNIRNPGAAFGILGNSGSLRIFILSGISIAALVIIGFVISKAKERSHVIALSLIGGGAAGNLIDRLRFGEVVDFLDFYVGGYHWPAFNVADTAISVGVALYLYCAYFAKPSTGKTG